MGRNNGGDDQRGAIARHPADAVLVHHQRIFPFQGPTGADHGPGQIEGLVRRHEAGAGDQEGGDLHIRIGVADQVPDNGREILWSQGFAHNLATDGAQTLRGAGGLDGDRIAGSDAQAAKDGLRQARLIGRHHIIAVGDHQGGEELSASGAHLDLARSGQAFGAKLQAFPRQHDHVFAKRVYGEGFGLQHRISFPPWTALWSCASLCPCRSKRIDPARLFKT